MNLPVIVSPMFLVSTPEMIVEASRNGLIGSVPLLNARTREACEEWLREISSELINGEPWAVNYISHKTNKRFEEDLELIREYEPPIVIASLGHPGRVVEAVKSYGGKVYADVATIKHARKSAEAGVDGLILVCAGAGGHAGKLNPFAFTQAVREFWDGTIILAGAISTGRDVLAAQTMGADYAYMGTRFIATAESSAPQEYKEMLVEAGPEDIIYTDSFSGVHANYLIPSLLKNNIDPASLKPREEVDLAHMTDAKAWRDIWSAGHGVTAVKEIQTMADVIGQLKQEYKEALKGVTQLV